VSVNNATSGLPRLVTAPEHLPLPAGTNRRRIYWRYAFAVGGYHLLGLLAFDPWFFSWTGVTLTVVGIYLFGGVGINLCYHRLLSHRSFQCPLWLEHFFAILGVCCLEDAPARWVAVHRLHHHRADHQPDPHSPLVSLFWGYIGWLFMENADLSRVAVYERYARDILRDRFYVKLERNIAWIILLSWAVFFLAGFVAGVLLGEPLEKAVQFGLSVWLWGVVVRTLGVWHITWSGNSFPHLYGYRNYETNDNSRNNFIVAMLTSGEGWHNNHHADPNSASNSHRWWEFDLTYLFLRLLAAVGLAWGVITPSRRTAPAGEPTK
jgi:fatty-acid desaturase